MNKTIRRASEADLPALHDLYKKVAVLPGGIARKPEEISPEWLETIFLKTTRSGICLLGFDEESTLIAEIHGWKPEPACFNHVFSEITMVIHPEFQGRGLGKWIFSELIVQVKSEFPEVSRLELFVRESNIRGQRLYKSLGFHEEGRLKRRIISSNGLLEDDILMGLVW